MFREKVIIETWPFTKKELVEHRKSDAFKEGVDWQLDKTPNGNPVIVWTSEGLVKLLAVKNLKVQQPAVAEDAEISPPETKVSEDKSKEDTCPAIVRQRLPNRRLVACEIRGQWENVWVRDSSLLRPGNIITAVHRGGKWVGLFKTNNVGKVFAG
jgi:hypothetical protein